MTSVPREEFVDLYDWISTRKPKSAYDCVNMLSMFTWQQREAQKEHRDIKKKIKTASKRDRRALRRLLIMLEDELLRCQYMIDDTATNDREFLPLSFHGTFDVRDLV